MCRALLAVLLHIAPLLSPPILFYAHTHITYSHNPVPLDPTHPHSHQRSGMVRISPSVLPTAIFTVNGTEAKQAGSEAVTSSSMQRRKMSCVLGLCVSVLGMGGV